MKLCLFMSWAILLTGCLAESPSPGGKPMPDHGNITLTIPRDPAADELIKLSVTVGLLPEGSRIVLRSGRGELLGSISPFGRASNRPGMSYVIPVPAEEIVSRKLTLNLSLEETDKKKARVPTDAEVLELKLHLGR